MLSFETALKLSAWCKLTFDERVVLHRVDRPAAPLKTLRGTSCPDIRGMSGSNVTKLQRKCEERIQFRMKRVPCSLLRLRRTVGFGGRLQGFGVDRNHLDKMILVDRPCAMGV